MLVAPRSNDRSGPDGLLFAKVCECFEELIKPSVDRHRGQKLMRKLWDMYGVGRHELFPLMRLILPHLDTERVNYRAKQRMLAKMYIDLLALPESSEDAQKMLNWKKPSAGYQRNEQGNFPEVVHAVIKDRCELRRGQITISKINGQLDAFADAPDYEKKRNVLAELHKATTAQEQRWILRIITKDMHIGMKEESIFNMLHPDARELYNSVCNLRATCEQCSDPSFRLDAISICPFKPFKPRLAAREKWRDVHKVMGRKGEYVAEYKLDGERLVLHYKRGRAPGGQDDRAEWWTRNCKNFNSCYGEAMDSVLRECLQPSVNEVVLDGEMMVWNTETCEFGAFGENRGLGDYMRRLVEGTQPCYVVFDILWLNGESLASMPLSERRERLETAVKWKSHSMERSEQTIVAPQPHGTPPSANHTEEVMNWLDRAMARGCEGIVFKSLASPYEPGSRDKQWLKLKPDHVHDMGDELDLLILAGYFGEGTRRSGGVSHFLLGVRAPSSDKHKFPNAKYPLFYPCCKVGTGYTFNSLQELRTRLEPAQRPWLKAHRPEHLCGWSPAKKDDEPDVWYVPTQSVVMAVAAYELVSSEIFKPSALTLRFPRCSALRYDKAWNECEEYESLTRRVKDGKAKVASSKRSAAEVARSAAEDLEHGGAGGKRSKREGVRKTRQVGVLSHLRLDADALRSTAVESGALNGETVVVKGFAVAAGSTRSVESLQKLVRSLGGEVHVNPTAETTLIIDADQTAAPNPQIQAILDKAIREGEERFDVVRAAWLLDCKEAHAKLPLEPKYVLYARPETKALMLSTMDEWGDRYAQYATAESMQSAMHLVRRESLCHRADAPGGAVGRGTVAAANPRKPKVAGLHDAVAAQDEKELLEQLRQLNDDDLRAITARPLSMLLGVVAFSPRAAIRMRLRLAGARTVDEPAAEVTHALLPPSSVADGTCAAVRSALSGAKSIALSSDTGTHDVCAHIVTEAWLDTCEKQCTRVSEKHFAIHEARC